MTEKLGWKIRGKRFADDSLLESWTKIEESGVWHWQYDTHELTFDIYEHDARYWKLYRVRYPSDMRDGYRYDYGGQACEVALVAYLARSSSPHSNMLMQPGDLEWVRTSEIDHTIHRVVRTGRETTESGMSRAGMGQTA